MHLRRGGNAHRDTILLGSTVRLLASLMHGQALPLSNDALELFSFPSVLSLSREGQKRLQRVVCILRRSCMQVVASPGHLRSLPMYFDAYHDEIAVIAVTERLILRCR